MKRLHLYFTIIILFLTTCTPRHKGTNVDPELYDVYVDFLNDCKIHGIDIDEHPRLSNLKKRVMSEETVGICISDENILYKYRNVYVSNDITDEFLLKYIAYHEMGHCIFNLPHDESGDLRIMSSEINVLNKELYEKNWNDMRYHYFKKIREGHQPNNKKISSCTIKK